MCATKPSEYAAVFPQEIFDQILRDLQGDKAALSACSLTCRAWLWAARSLRFRSIAIHMSQVSHRRYTAIKRSVQCSTHHSDIGQRVRELTLSVIFLKRMRDENTESDFTSIYSLPLKLMPNVRCLILNNTDAWNLVLLSAPDTLFPHLEVLQLRETVIQDTLAFHEFLQSHPTCQMVRFHQCGVFPRTPWLMRDLTLDTLSVKESNGDCIDGMTVLAALALPGVRLRIRRVGWSCQAWRFNQRWMNPPRVEGELPEQSDLGDLLRQSGSYLEELCLMIYPDNPPPSYDRRTDIHSLASATALRRLEIFCPGNKGRFPCTWVADTLDTISAAQSTLETLCMICRGSIETYILTLEWEHMDRTLARLLKMLPQLRLEFDFRRVPGVWTMVEVEEAIMDKLPRVAATAMHPRFSLGLLRPESRKLQQPPKVIPRGRG